MMSPAFSPTLSASSSTTAAASDQAMFTKPLDDFTDLFNFDDASFSAGESSHSPQTISPNHTPSPLPLGSAQSPFAYQPGQYEAFGNPDQDFDFGFDFATMEEKKQPIASGSSDVIEVKQEPVEFGFPVNARQQQQQQQAAPAPGLNLEGLPVDQQAALQQLMTNIVAYQQKFGLDVNGNPTSGPSAQEPQQQQAAQQAQSNTIQPSMVFSSASATPSHASNPSSSSFVSPVAQLAPIHEEGFDDDRLVSVEPGEMAPSSGPSRTTRADSTMSTASDVDTKIDSLVPLPLIFSAGKGKGGKKGGGMSSVVRGDDEDIDDDDSWRPSPEEYKKLSSKEKRQLRNKLSARAFRNRRKDYIGTLEAHIRDRDTVIESIRQELMTSRSETQDLRQELEALKKSTMSILHPESAQPEATHAASPTLFSALTMSPSLPTAGPSTIKRTTSSPRFNPRKDLPSSPSAFDASRGFWGGSESSILGGGSTICHTMLTPDLVLPPNPTTHPFNLPRQNINPHLNEASSSSRMPSLAMQPPKDLGVNTFAEWSEQHAFSLRSMDAYRMQMWGRLAREAQADKSGLTGDLRPKFFVETSASSSSSSSAGDEAAHIASIATGHITSKLAHSFFSAFTTALPGKFDTDKLAAVVTGRAKLQVVPDVAAAVEDDLAKALGGLRLQSGVGSEGRGVRARENPLGVLGGWFRCGGVATHA